MHTLIEAAVIYGPPPQFEYGGAIRAVPAQLVSLCEFKPC
jgi:hypothetical protein